MPEDSVEAIVTDPPYGLSAQPDIEEVLKHWLAGDDYEHRGGGFMGKTWDSFVPGPKVWAECLRALKPGGHLLAFFGTRTYDLGVIAIRLAGFEIRDCLAWHYGSGFPKSLDVSKAIDKRGGESVGWFGPWFRQWREENGITQREVAQLFPSKTGNLTGCVANWELGLNLPTPEQFNAIVAEFGLPFSDIQEAEREVVGKKTAGMGSGKTFGMLQSEGNNSEAEKEVDLTAPATDLARQWQGWGTALKPAFEPIILARKPLIGTVAENVTRFGTGALNVDGCRVGTEDDIAKKYPNGPGGKTFGDNEMKLDNWKQNQKGRWPANLVLDDRAAAMLDEQSGESTAGAAGAKGSSGFAAGYDGEYSIPYGDTGGASRFFYQAKANSREKNAGLGDGFEVKRPDVRGEVAAGHFHEKGVQPQKNSHPTVKPIDLMRWLVRLVTPPGGTVLDPFIGSGTTGIAAGLEGFDFIGIEQDAEYLRIAEARIKWWAGQSGETADILKKVKSRREREAETPTLFD